MPGPGWIKREERRRLFEEGIDREFSSKIHLGSWDEPHVDLHVWGIDGKIDKKKGRHGFGVEDWDLER